MRKFSAVFILLFVSTFFGQANNESENGDSDKLARVVSNSLKDCVTMDFHYLILENSRWTEKVRRIEVFLDEKAFSEENLKILFEYLSSKNPEPAHLTIVVHTNWKQLPLSSDCPPSVMSNMPDRPDKYDYHQATFYRRERGGIVEYFHYYPILKTSDFKEVILKGRRTATIANPQRHFVH